VASVFVHAEVLAAAAAGLGRAGPGRGMRVLLTDGVGLQALRRQLQLLQLMRVQLAPFSNPPHRHRLFTAVVDRSCSKPLRTVIVVARVSTAFSTILNSRSIGRHTSKDRKNVSSTGFRIPKIIAFAADWRGYCFDSCLSVRLFVSRVTQIVFGVGLLS